MKKNGQKNITLDNALLDLRRYMTEALRVEAKKLGHSLSHFEVLKYVAEKGDPTMKGLSDHLRITPPSASSLVDGLVDKGFISRTHSKKDRRTIRIELTAKSQRLLNSLHRSKVSIFNNMLKKLNSEDRKQLAVLLAKCTISSTKNRK